MLEKLDKILAILESEQSNSRIYSQLDQLCKKLSIKATVIGGMAVAVHGYKRYTADIDIITTQNDAYALANALIQSGWNNIQSNKLEDPRSKIIINLCAEGVKAGKTTFPAPESQNIGISVASLPLLLSLKILANRSKDRSDFVELIKSNNLTEQYIIDNIFPRLHNKMDQKQALQLWHVALKENSQNAQS